jgi:hypothetical protein
MSLSELFKAAIYEYLFTGGTFKGKEINESPILRVDRSPKGNKQDNKTKTTFKEVVKEIQGFDLKKLKPVPKGELKQVYNLFVK